MTSFAGSFRSHRPPIRVVIGLIAIWSLLLGVIVGARLFRHTSVPVQPNPYASRTETFDFYSPALGRVMPLIVYLPPGYATTSESYPVLYMLHGLGGHQDEWQGYGLFDQASAMMSRSEVPPYLIVLPEGEDGYWFDHADGGPRWGQYLAKDVVNAVDSRYRTLTQREFRAVGGLSMGADGALQIALNNPDVFGVVQAHGPVLRPYEIASPAYGDPVYFNAHYPVTLMQTKQDVARSLKIEIDVGDVDLWNWSATALHNELTNLNIPHEWHVWSGGHDYNYWIANLPNDLAIFGDALRATYTEAP